MLKKILGLGILLCLVSFAFAQETLTITTYYPSPYGVYREMRAQRMAIGDGYIQGGQYCWPGETCANQIYTDLDGDSSYDSFPDEDLVDLVVQGNVGIGTTGPGAKLDVRAGGETLYWGNNALTYPSPPAAAQGNLVGKGLTADFRTSLQDGTGRVNQYWNAYYDSAAAAHKYQVTGEASNRYLTSAGIFGWYVAPSGTAGNNITWTNAMYINNSGNVGIGTTGPGTKLSVRVDGDGANAVLRLSSILTNWNVGNGPRLLFHGGSDDRPFGEIGSFLQNASTGANAYMTFSTRDSEIVAERVRITSAGNVGIGTTSPNANALLDVSSTTKAFMPPRMTTTQRDAVASPTAGMVIYNTTTNKLNVYTTAWEAVTSG